MFHPIVNGGMAPIMLAGSGAIDETEYPRPVE
jgi:hypothetical protein